MSQQAALLLFSLLIIWLFFKERKRRAFGSGVLWIPIIWAFIVGSRPVSDWFGNAPTVQTTAHATAAAIDYLEGSPFDRMVFFALIAAGVAILIKRKQRLVAIVSNNKMLFGFYLYLAISVLWSDFPFVSFKRWIKDFGNVIMALVVLSEIDPLSAMKSVLLRCVCLLIPLSVMVIKYFPDIGRYYDRWSYGAYFCGIAGDKNLLGMSLFVCSLFLLALFLEARHGAAHSALPWPVLVVLLLMAAWLLIKAHSATAVICTVISSVILYLLDSAGPRKFVLYGALSAVFLFFVFIVSDAAELFRSVLGRDLTFTGRTDIWKMLLSEKINPFVGVGFYSFWLGERSEKLSEKYHYSLNEAHNGYLETYLNSGIIGAMLLIAVLSYALWVQWKRVKRGDTWSAFNVSFLIGMIIYNMSEAAYNRLSIIWFAFMLVVTSLPASQSEPMESAEKVIPRQPAMGILRVN